MPNRRRCHTLNQRGRPCGAPALREGSRCFWHAPETEAAAADARRLGGLRRRREAAIAGAFDLDGMQLGASLLRVSDLGLVDILEMESSPARSRLLLQWLASRARLEETVVGEARLQALEGGVGQKVPDTGPQAPTPRIVVRHPDGRVEELQRDEPRKDPDAAP